MICNAVPIDILQATDLIPDLIRSCVTRCPLTDTAAVTGDECDRRGERWTVQYRDVIPHHVEDRVDAIGGCKPGHRYQDLRGLLPNSWIGRKRCLPAPKPPRRRVEDDVRITIPVDILQLPFDDCHAVELAKQRGVEGYQ